MEDIIYVVTAGCYSDYHIEAVFKDKSKAEYYCTCHEDCEIEEYSLSDSNIFTPFESVVINFDIYKNKSFWIKLNVNADSYNEACNIVDRYLEDLDNRRLYSYKNG